MSPIKTEPILTPGEVLLAIAAVAMLIFAVVNH